MKDSDLFKKLFDEEMRTFNECDLEDGFKLYYKIYSGCIKAGFNSEQAMDILKTLIASSIRNLSR